MKWNNENKVFISYHSSKVELVEHLSRYLERNDIKTWYAKKDIRGGEKWDIAINEAIKSCYAVVLLFCSNADASEEVKRELSLANRYKKPVFWVRVECVEPNNLSYFLTSIQWMDWLDNRDVTLEKLVQDIYALKVDDFSEKNACQSKEAIEHKGLFKDWAKGIISFKTEREVAECVAKIYFSISQNNPDSSIILPTGRSAMHIFRAMIRIANDYNACPFGDVHIFSDTETFGVGVEHDSSRTKFILDNLIMPLKELGKAPLDSQLKLLSGIYSTNDPILTAQKELRKYPPIVHASSISPVGEILAYEVGTYNSIEDIIDDVPRILEVGEHSKKYIDPNQPSKSIISIGLGSALSSNIILIVVFDKQKANILKRLFVGPMTAGIPATLLRKHQNAFILTTDAIAMEAGIDDEFIKRKSIDEVVSWITSN